MKLVFVVAIALVALQCGGVSFASDRAAVIYFSATGTTRAIAEKIADAANCELFEIVPQLPYTKEDLDYRNDASRANKEMNDPTSRPEIFGDLSYATSFRVIYLGYPIWWGTAPRIISTFLDKYDLSGAKVRLFCTSGSSSIDKSVADIREAYPSLEIEGAKRINISFVSDVNAWVKSFK